MTLEVLSAFCRDCLLDIEAVASSLSFPALSYSNLTMKPISRVNRDGHLGSFHTSLSALMFLRLLVCKVPSSCEPLKSFRHLSKLLLIFANCSSTTNVKAVCTALDDTLKLLSLHNDILLFDDSRHPGNICNRRPLFWQHAGLRSLPSTEVPL